MNREQKKLKRQDAENLQNWLEFLGPTHAERAKSLHEIFEQRTFTMKTSLYSEGKGFQFVFFAVSRSLAGMETRERTYLKMAELLNSAADGTVPQYRHWRATLTWGDGKGHLDHWYVWWSRDGQVPEEQFRAAMSALQINVDIVINVMQQHLVDLRNDANLGPAYQAIVDEFAEDLVPSGHSGWLKRSEIDRSPFAVRSPHALYIGSLADGTPLTYSGDGSVVTVAPPGAGKTQCNVVPNLLTWEGPAVVLDISGDLYEHTSAWRSQNVGPVYKFSPLEPEVSHRYNPLTFVRRDSDYLWEDSRLLAEMMIVPSLTSDPFWENEARTVLTAAIASVCHSNPPEQRPMHAVLDVLFGGDAWDEMILGLRMAVDVRVMMQHATALSSMNEKTLSSVLQTARSSLGAWTGERVARVTTHSDWSPLDLRANSNPSIYIYMRPNEVEAYLSLLRVFIGQHIRMLTGGPVPPIDAPPILLMLDELPRLRNMPPVDEALNIGRKYGLRLWMFAQSVGQFRTAYENADGMLGSCAVRIFMNPTGADGLAEQLSEELGYVESLNDGSRKRLVEAAELAGPEYRDLQVVLATGAKPAKVSKDFAFQSAMLKERMGAQSLERVVGSR